MVSPNLLLLTSFPSQLMATLFILPVAQANNFEIIPDSTCSHPHVQTVSKSCSSSIFKPFRIQAYLTPTAITLAWAIISLLDYWNSLVNAAPNSAHASCSPFSVQRPDRSYENKRLHHCQFSTFQWCPMHSEWQSLCCDLHDLLRSVNHPLLTHANFLLTTLPCLARLLQPLWPSCCSLNTPGMFPPQGLRPGSSPT